MWKKSCTFAKKFNGRLISMSGREYLLKYGIQATAERVMVVEYLMKYHTHPTGDEVFRGLVRNGANVSHATVFNTLKRLTEGGALHSLSIEEGVARYDIDLSAHAHFRCNKCGKIMDIKLKRSGSFELPEGYKIDGIDYLISGVCSECERNETQGIEK